MASVGSCLYMPVAGASGVLKNNRVERAGFIVNYTASPKLSVGAGLAVDDMFGYPMWSPTFNLEWTPSDRFKTKVLLSDGFTFSTGYDLSKQVNLSVVAEMTQHTALMEKEGRNMEFTHRYFVAGVRPEIKLGKSGLALPVTVGVSAYRPAFYQERSQRTFFASGDFYYFSPAFYASAGITYGF